MTGEGIFARELRKGCEPVFPGVSMEDKGARQAGQMLLCYFTRYAGLMGRGWMCPWLCSRFLFVAYRVVTVMVAVRTAFVYVEVEGVE